MNSPIFQELSEAEHGWIDLQLKVARAFVSSFSPTDTESPIRLEALDRAFANWLDTQTQNVQEINDAINAVGVAFGSILVAQAGFRWTIATDANGTDLAVRALPDRGDVLVFPANFVSKRWERKEPGFLVDSSQKISRYVEKIRSEWGSRKHGE